jgi:2-polyprenyl-3-methyl-5-hydroxy-6-metoxy-1,4-benzoquinol methylase
MSMMELKNTGERVIEPENRHDVNYLRHMAAYAFALQFVKDKLVLEDGCGSGYGSYYLATNGAKEVVGIDVATEAVEYARSRYNCKNLAFRQMNSTELSFSDESFDIATSFQVIEHIEDADKFLRQMTRVLKRQGIALISTPNKQTYSPNTDEPENPFHVREFYLDQFEKLLSKYFNKVEIVGVNPSPRLEEMEKRVNSSFKTRVKKMLKRLGLSFVFKMIPKGTEKVLNNPSEDIINASDFSVEKCVPSRSLDFIAICRKA